MQSPERRKNIMLGTAGHVDHGKTALVKLLTGCETDSLAEEKQRGLTIDLGFAPCRLADTRVVGVVDVPGHVDFIRNMVAGAHGVDVAILVVAADDGIMPQTLEHLHILSLMGLRHGLVALTKVDLVDETRRQGVVAELCAVLRGTFLETAPICPVSNVTGEGFDAFYETLNRVVHACDERPTTGLFRMWVDDAFAIRGAGTVITGIPVSGSVRVGDGLHLLPNRLGGHVRRMQVYGADATCGRAGECVALNIPELDHQAVHRGLVLSAGDPVEPATMAEAELTTLSSIREALEDYLEVQFHVGTAAVAAHLAMLEVSEMTGGQSQMVQLRMAEPLPLVAGERFVIRAPAANGGVGLRTVGGGRILGISHVRLRRKKQWTLDLLRARRAAIDNAERWCELMLSESVVPVRVTELAQTCRLSRSELNPILDRWRANGLACTTPSGGWLHAERIRRAGQRLLDELQAFHLANPQRAGAQPGELTVQKELGPEVFALVTASLERQGRLVRHGSTLCQADWTPKLPDGDEQLCTQIASLFQKADWTPPALQELQTSLRVTAERIEKCMRLLMDRGTLIRLDPTMIMHRDAITAAQQVAMKLFRAAPSFSTMQFRDALGVSRKFAVPILDYLDRIRFTVRSGHDRTPGVEGKRSFEAAQGPKAG